jgi:hypothetical protein
LTGSRVLINDAVWMSSCTRPRPCTPSLEFDCLSTTMFLFIWTRPPPACGRMHAVVGFKTSRREAAAVREILGRRPLGRREPAYSAGHGIRRTCVRVHAHSRSHKAFTGSLARMLTRAACASCWRTSSASQHNAPNLHASVAASSGCQRACTPPLPPLDMRTPREPLHRGSTCR